MRTAKILPLVAGAAAGMYVLFFSEQAKEQRARELIDQGVTPACESPQVERAALRVLRRSWQDDAAVSSAKDVSQRLNQRTCSISITSAQKGQVVNGATFTVELDPPSRMLFVALSDATLALMSK